MIPPDLFDSAVSALSQHAVFISDITDMLQRDPDHLTYHFQSSWLWILSILELKKIRLPPTVPQKEEVERLVKAAIDRSRKQRDVGPGPGALPF